MEYSLAMRNEEILPFFTTWMKLEGIILSKISQTKRQILYDIACMWSLKIKLRNRENRLVVARAGMGGRNGEILVKGHKLSFIR